MSKLDFDDYIRNGEDDKALKMLSDELYNSGKIGGTRKELLLRAVKYAELYQFSLNCKNCIFCLDCFTREDIDELKEMGESFYNDDKDGFICPDCYDNFNRLDGEQKIQALLDGADYDWGND